MDKDLSDKIDYLLASVKSEQQAEADQIKSKTSRRPWRSLHAKHNSEVDA